MTTPEKRRRRERRTEALLTVAIIFFGLAAGWQFFHVNPERAATDDALTAQQDALKQTQDSLRRTQQSIQQDRANAIRTQCQQTNRRYHNTVDFLHDYERKVVRRHPDKADQIHNQIKANIELISALVPPRDCRALVQRFVHPDARQTG